MHIGLIISVVLHLALLVCTLFAFQSQRQLPSPTPEPVAVGMITPSEATKVRLGTPTAGQPETEAKETPKGEVAKKEAAKPRPAPAAPPPPPAEPPAPKAEQKDDPIANKLAEAPLPAPSPPTPAPDAHKKLDAAAEKLKADEQRAADALRLAEEARKLEEQKRAGEQKRAEERRRLEEQRRQADLKRKENERKRREAAAKRKRDEAKKRLEAEAAAKSKFDADRIAALLNKVPDKSAPPPSAPPNEPTKAKGPALGAPDGRDKQLSAGEKAMLNGIIESRLNACWRLPSAGGGSDTPVVTLRWRLNPDGSLDGDPVVVEATRNDALFRLAAENAIRAVRECAPFPLPRDKYSHWKVIIRDFDPGAMLR